MNKEYILPVKLYIDDDDNPDMVAKEIAERIYDSIKEFLESNHPLSRVNRCEVDYSIFIKTETKAFRESVREI